MARAVGVVGVRPPSFVSRASLAAELEIGQSTVDDLVRRGVLPKPIKIGGSSRWSWSAVQEALVAMGTGGNAADPFLQALNDET